jgi:transketolase
VPGVEVSAGSLGHGLPMACGIALAGKRDHRKYRVFALISDGECDEGTTWESALFASQLDLDNLTVIIDYNKLQGFGYTKNVLQLEPLCQKWKSFGWQTREVNGHSFQELERTFKTLPFKQNAPSVVIAHTIKGFGGPPIHINQISSQYKPPTTEEYEAVINQLSQT